VKTDFCYLGTRGASQYFELEADPVNDFEFDLIDLDTVQIGEAFAVVTKITVRKHSAISLLLP